MDVYAHEDYRALLGQLLRVPGRSSMRTVARRAGCSPALLSQIVSGRRDLRPERVEALAAALELGPGEAAFVRDLVLRVHGSTEIERRGAAERVSAARAGRSGQQ